MNKEEINHHEESTNFSKENVVDINISEIIPNVIDNVIVTIVNNYHTLFLPLGLTGLEFKNWKRGRGGIFSRDVLNYSLGLNSGKYVLIKSKELNCIARLIADEEQLQFFSLKLIDGKIKDKDFMILKHIKNGEKLSGTSEYINENSVYLEQIDYIPVINKEIEKEDDDHTSSYKSISLFTQ